MDWVAKYPNLIVLRTFSKWAGLGGLRVGYGIFPPAIIEQLWKIKPPYNVNVAGAQAALASLADRDTLMDNVTRLIQERERLYVELERFGFLQPVPGSRANFILCQVLGRDARDLKLALEQQGVLVRHFAKPGSGELHQDLGRPAGGHRAAAHGAACGVIGTRTGPGLIRRRLSMRQATIVRTTNETSIELALQIDGSGQAQVNTGIGFYDHMLTLFAGHGLFDLRVEARGDLHVDEHHTAEDVAICLGKPLTRPWAIGPASCGPRIATCRWTRRWALWRSTWVVAPIACSMPTGVRPGWVRSAPI